MVLVKCCFHILSYFPYYPKVHKAEIRSIDEGLDPKDELEQHLILERMLRKTQPHFLYRGGQLFIMRKVRLDAKFISLLSSDNWSNLS